MKRTVTFLALAALACQAWAADFTPAPPPDPLVLNYANSVAATLTNRATLGITPQQFTVNPAKKTLLLFVAGQSQWTNVTPSAYVPTNSTAVLQLNINDGAVYPIPSSGLVLGTTNEQSPLGPGNIPVRVADQLVTNGRFDFVIIIDFAIGGTPISEWTTGGSLFDWGVVAIKRATALGMTCNTTGITCGFIWGQGEADNQNGTSQSVYANSLSAWGTHMTGNNFTGRIFVCEESWLSGTVSTNVQNAQLGIVDNVTYFSGGNMDSIGAGGRQADNTHFNDTGAVSAMTLMVNAMHASGAPY